MGQVQQCIELESHLCTSFFAMMLIFPHFSSKKATQRCVKCKQAKIVPIYTLQIDPVTKPTDVPVKTPVTVAINLHIEHHLPNL